MLIINKVELSVKAKSLLLYPWHLIPLVDRWMISELAKSLFFSISAFTVLSLSLGEILYVIRMISEANLKINSAIEILIFSLPSYIVISLPMAALLSTLITYAKLESNSEIKALYSIGYTKRRVIVPALLLGTILSITTFFFNDFLVPRSNLQAELSLREGIGQSLDINFKKDIVYSKFTTLNSSDGFISRKNNLNQLFYAKEYSNNRMKGVTVVEHLNPDEKRIIIAKNAYPIGNSNTWKFLQGNIVTLSREKTLSNESFEKYDYKLDSGPIAIARLPKDANNMNINQAIIAKGLYEQSGNLKEARRISVRIQEKFTFPIACFIFSLIGVNVALIVKNSSNQSQMFGLSIILILTYYLICFLFSALGVSGTLNPILSTWSPIVICFICGEYLIRKQ